MTRLWAPTADFNAIAPGDSLPVLIKWETDESIRRYAARHGGDDDNNNDDALPRQALAAYIIELLGKGFPPERLDAPGSTLDIEQLRPIRANDTISLSGQVTGKETADGQRLVHCAVTVENDRNEPVAQARAIISL